MDNEEKKDWQKEICEQVDKQIEEISNQQVQPGNVDYLYKLVDIKKDFKEMEESKMYGARGNYGEYGESYGRRGVPGSGRGRYRENYGARGVDAKYRGEDIMDDMYQAYQEYNDGMQTYGADQKTMESFKYMVKSFKDYYKHLKQNVSSQEEVKILDQAIDEMANM